ncbi:hypothetical protein [Streptomyces sp. NPDC047968]
MNTLAPDDDCWAASGAAQQSSGQRIRWFSPTVTAVVPRPV